MWRLRLSGGSTLTASSHPVTAERVQALLDKHPKLTQFGYGPPWNKDGREAYERYYDHERQAMVTKDLPTIQYCYDYLSRMDVVSFRHRGLNSSYGWKHFAENARGMKKGARGAYVSNGDLIAAALLLNLPIKFTDGPNPILAIRKPVIDPRPLLSETFPVVANRAWGARSKLIHLAIPFKDGHLPTALCGYYPVVPLEGDGYGSRCTRCKRKVRDSN